MSQSMPRLGIVELQQMCYVRVTLVGTRNRCCVGQVLVDTVAVEREEQRLEQENTDLRTILKQYLDGISVNEDVMNNPLNPLMVVNNRLQLILQQRDKARAAALQEVM